ncbi:MAG TPA: hypothetical protein PK467_20300 [Candidatus Wallbacteria bacterium]|nr:hypothetical protein [Candidatus Wallbacteria bacterium]
MFKQEQTFIEEKIKRELSEGKIELFSFNPGFPNLEDIFIERMS